MRSAPTAAARQRNGGDPPDAESAGVPLESDVAYTCPACFEVNYLAFDPSGGRRQRFVEDCPVCCRPIDFEVSVDRDGDPVVERCELAS